MRRRRRLVPWGLASAFALTNAAAAPPTPPCSAIASFDVERGVVGQQIHHRIRIERRDDVGAVDWIDPPTFPGFRAEWLPAASRPDGALRVHFEHRALFPERTGRLATAPARLRCRADSDDGAGEFVVEVAPVHIQIDAAPETGRPPGFTGLIGPIAIERIVTPQQIALGESVRIAVMLRGHGNLWNVDDPLPALAAADVFRRRPETTLGTGREITVKRHFHYDVVPLAAGEFVIPALQLDFFDPDSGRFGSVDAEAIAVRVEPAAATDDDVPALAAATAAGTEFPNRAERPGHGTSRWLPAIAAGLVVMAAVLGWWYRQRARHANDRSLAVLAGTADAPDQAEALSRALRIAIERHLPGSASATPEELAARGVPRGPVDAAVRLLAEIERARFDPNAPPADHDAVRRAIRSL